MDVRFKPFDSTTSTTTTLLGKLVLKTLNEKEEKEMILISKSERFKLEEIGVKMGENGISHTVKTGKQRKYYLCETKFNLSKLNKIRNK